MFLTTRVQSYALVSLESQAVLPEGQREEVATSTLAFPRSGVGLFLAPSLPPLTVTGCSLRRFGEQMQRVCVKWGSPCLGPPVVPFYPFWEGSPRQQKAGYPYSNLSTGGPSCGSPRRPKRPETPRMWCGTMASMGCWAS